MLASMAVEETGVRCISEGDTVIVYERHDRMKAVTVCKESKLQNRFGVFPHSEWIGKPFGRKVLSEGGGGFVYLLAPSPELWTLVLSQRTQILYLSDISLVTCFLEMRPGSVVLESGTGSGSLTTSMARAIAPTGHIFTFDFHEQRATSARQDFERNKLSDIVTVGVRDIQGQGFPDELIGKADAVFLDLPQPWLAISSAAKMLKDNGSICSFSPCIEQVQHACEALSKHNFTDIRTFESLLRTYEVRVESFPEMTLNGRLDESDTSPKSPPHKRPCPPAGVGSDGNNKPRQSMNAKGAKNTPGLAIAKPLPEGRGHTGYLTFARRRM